MLLWGAPPAVTPNAVSGWGQSSSGVSETVDHEMDGAIAGRPPRCDPNCGQRVGATSSGASETEDHEMDGAFAGCPTRCDPTCGQRVGAVSLEAVMQRTYWCRMSCASAGDGAGRQLLEYSFGEVPGVLRRLARIRRL